MSRHAARALVERQLVVGDALLGRASAGESRAGRLLALASYGLGDRGAIDWPSLRPARFSALAANPPYVNVERIEPAVRRFLLERDPCAQRRFDLAGLFAARAIDLVAPGGRAALLVPHPLLTQHYGEPVRRRLLSETTLERVVDLRAERLFPGAAIRVVIVVFTARAPAPDAVTRVEATGALPGAFRQSDALAGPGAMLRLDAAGEAPRAASAPSTVTLGDAFAAGWGARGVPVSDFQTRAPAGPHARAMVKGADVSPWRLAPPTRYLEYDRARLYRPSHPVLFTSPKLVVAKVTGARGLVAALDADGLAADDSVALVVPRDRLDALPPAEARRHQLTTDPRRSALAKRYPLELVLALLSSAALGERYRRLVGGGLNVYPDDLERLPLPPPEAVESDAGRALVHVARMRLTAGPADAPALDRAVDRLAAQLLGDAVPAAPTLPLGRAWAASWGARGVPASAFVLERAGKDCLPMVRGRDITPFRARQVRWLRYAQGELYRPSHPIFFSPGKVVVAEVTGARGLVAAVDDAGLAADHSVICAIPKWRLDALDQATLRRHRLKLAPGDADLSRSYPPALVAALLNSRALGELHRTTRGDGLNVFPGTLEALPLPAPESAEGPLGRALAAAGERASAAATPELLAAARAEIDALAYALYA